MKADAFTHMQRVIQALRTDVRFLEREQMAQKISWETKVQMRGEILGRKKAIRLLEEYKQDD